MSEPVKLRVADETKAAQETSQVKGSQGKKPTKQLPTVRVSFVKQMDILRAYAAASGGSAQMVSLKEVAEMVDLAIPTVSLANPFFVDVKFVQRNEGVGMMPATELLNYAHAYQWDKETAAHKLAPLLSKTWFWAALQPRLNFQEIPEDQVVTLLAEKASAGPIYRSQLKMILEYLEAAGMINRMNGVVTAVKDREQPSSSVTESQETPSETPVETVATPLSRSAVSTSFAQSGQGAVNFEISVHVNMTEISGWEPARIASFFSGIAQVLSAKGAVERKSSQE